MGATTFNPMSAVGTLLQSAGKLLQAEAGGGVAQAPAQQAAQAGPVDQFQAAPQQAAAPAAAPAAPAAPAAGGDISGQLQQLVQALGSLVQMIQQMLGQGGAQGQGQGAAAAGGAGAGAAAAAAAGAGGAQASASASASAGAGAAAAPAADPFSQLQQQFGAWSGVGKNKDAPKGPKATALVKEAEQKLASGDTSGASEAYSKAQKTGSPVMLDLNHDGKLGTTGVSTAKNRADNQTGKMVNFDLDGDGKKEQVEWMDGKGDGVVVDDTDGGATAAANGNGEINGTRLFGDQGGKFANGYQKLAKYDTNGDGKLTGAELQGLKVWVDNGDAKVQQGELKSMADLGITSLDVGVNNVTNARGENLMQSAFTQNGQSFKSEDVWFAKK